MTACLLGRWPATLMLALAVVLAGACGGDDPSAARADPAVDPAPDPAPGGVACEAAEPAELGLEVLEVRPHRSDAFTQGLLVDDGELFESTGRVGESSLRQLDPDTGEVLRMVEVGEGFFAEGLALDDRGRFVQLTWTDGVALVWDRDTFAEVERYRYDGQGWGLTTLDDDTLVMSDGSDVLTLREPEDFSIRERRQVLRSGGSTESLNELDWDGTSLWANRYLTDELVRIEPDCMTVTGVADLSELRLDAQRTAAEQDVEIDVTNGVAHLPGTDRFLVTGKYWPTMYEVRFVEPAANG